MVMTALDGSAGLEIHSERSAKHRELDVVDGATEMELASVGIIASLELFQATGRRQYADKALD